MLATLWRFIIINISCTNHRKQKMQVLFPVDWRQNKMSHWGNTYSYDAHSHLVPFFSLIRDRCYLATLWQRSNMHPSAWVCWGVPHIKTNTAAADAALYLLDTHWKVSEIVDNILQDKFLNLTSLRFHLLLKVTHVQQCARKSNQKDVFWG